MVDRVHIPRHDAGPDMAITLIPGTWYVDRFGDLWHKCPKCKKGSVMLNHSVKSNGEVNASIACFSPCDYHVWGILDGWIYGEKQAGKKVVFEDED